MRLKNGKLVGDSETWWRQRRPEIVEEFDPEHADTDDEEDADPQQGEAGRGPGARVGPRAGLAHAERGRGGSAHVAVDDLPVEEGDEPREGEDRERAWAPVPASPTPSAAEAAARP